MGSEWKRHRLGDITSWSSGGTPSKSRAEYWDGTIPWISASSMDGNRYSDSKLKVTELGLQNGTRIAKKGSILLLVRGSILHQKIQVGIAERDLAFNQDVKALEVNPKFIEPWYLLFWFMAKERELLWLVENTGIGAGKLDTEIMQNLIVDIPPKYERNRILTFMKAIDDKIELNRQMNATLEAMAQALFKSWFVDFDPVIDKALAADNPIPDPLKKRAEIRKELGDKRKPLPEAIDAHFPDHFVYNDAMGWVPGGWDATEIKDIAEVIKGRSYKSSELSESKTALVTLKSFNRGGGYRLDGLKEFTGSYKPNQEVFAGEIVIAYTDVTQAADVIGKPAMVVSNEKYNHLVVSLDVAIVRPFIDSMKYFIYGTAKTNRFQCHTRAFSTGTTVLHLGRNAVPDYLVPLPNEDLLLSFSSQVKPHYKLIDLNTSQIFKLSALRDTLLPRLLSGQLRIPDAEKLVKDAI